MTEPESDAEYAKRLLTGRPSPFDKLLSRHQLEQAEPTDDEPNAFARKLFHPTPPDAA